MTPKPKAPANAGNPGSPSTGEPVYLAVGTLRRSHGIRGDMLVEVLTDFPERLKPGTSLYVGDKKQALKITRRRPHNEGMILGFEGISTAEQTAKYRAQTVYVPAGDRPPLPEGEYYHHQVIGLNVLTTDGEPLGQVVQVLATGANDVYVVQGPRGQVLLPARAEVVRTIDLDAGTMTVRLLPGLLPDEA